MPPRVLLVDDHNAVRSGLVLLFRSAGFEVVGEAATADAALAKTKELLPDLVLLDLALPHGSGLGVISKLSAISRVLVFSMHTDAMYVRQALLLGAGGYICKEASESELRDAALRVLAGQSYVYPTLAASLVSGPAKPRTGFAALSRREIEVLKHISLGYTNSEVGRELGVSARTVETYRVRLGAKLGLHSRAELVGYALENGLI